MTAASPPVLVWFRSDLRLADNEALTAAARSERPVLPVFILDDDTPDLRPVGGAGRWWLHHSLQSLRGSLRERGLPLVLRRGPAYVCLGELARETGADTVYFSHAYDRGGRIQEDAVHTHLASRGIDRQVLGGTLLFQPGEIRNATGLPYQVFTPFWRACLAAFPPGKPLPEPEGLQPPAKIPTSDALNAWNLVPKDPDWSVGFAETWRPGEGEAHRRLSLFVDTLLSGYGRNRDRPGVDATARLSPHLRFGEVSARQCWQAAKAHRQEEGAASFLRELGWREFCHHLASRHADIDVDPIREAFEVFPWRAPGHTFEAWKRGRTGFPIVDAGMRELWHTGWMHNRVRMIVASFLVKDLLVSWTEGERWFWDTLVDADPANNPANWQWVAGCGADAAPYFRIFNPVTQSRKFDPDGIYLRRWLPELARLADRHIHAPWQASAAVLADSGVRLGETYPAPVVDHAKAREEALEAFRSIR